MASSNPTVQDLCVVCHEKGEGDAFQSLYSSGAQAIERHSHGELKARAGQHIHKRCRDQLRKTYVSETVKLV